MVKMLRLPGAQLVRFGTVGSFCFCVDAAVLTSVRPWFGLYIGRMASYLVAATCGWLGNRYWTFRMSSPYRVRAAYRQWALFLAANGMGMLINGAVYVALTVFMPVCAAHPVLAVAAGAVAGMVANFPLSRSIVFR